MSAQVNLFQGNNYCRSLKGDDSSKSIPVVIRCEGCKRVKVINPSCNKRNCERCNKKRSNRLFKRYFPKMLAMQNNPKRNYKEKFTMVTLTGFRIPFDEHFRHRVDWFTSCAQKFLAEEFPTAGIMATEMTVRYKTKCVGSFEADGIGGGIGGPASIVDYERELYVHAHGICFGGFKFKPDFDRAWATALLQAMIKNNDIIPQLEMSINERHERFSWLERVHRLKGSFNYVLGYVLKGVAINDEELEAVKRLKYVRTWGELYGIKEERYDMYCKDCHGRCYLDLEEQTTVDAMMGKLQSTLKIILVRRGDPPPWQSHVVVSP